MLYMIVESFRDGDPVPVYRRFRNQGRLAPDGLRYVASWVSEDLHRCFQIMECDDRALLEQWIARWDDLVEFEVTPVVTSADAAKLVGGHDIGRPSAKEREQS
jgi:hypothetical protein